MRSVIVLPLIFTFLVPIAYAEQTPKPSRKDSRIKTVNYDMNNTVDLYVHFDFGVTVEYEENEVIILRVLGDEVEWSAYPMKSIPNILVIKPTGEHVPTTSLYIKTNKRKYYYQLYSLELTPNTKHRLTLALNYEYPNSYLRNADKQAYRRLIELEYKDKAKEKQIIKEQKQAEKMAFDPTKINSHYVLSGSTEYAPMSVFDDGKFMYLEFSKFNELPVIFSVDKDRHESMINYRVKEPYVIVERLYNRLSLRRNDIVTTVKRSDSMYSRTGNTSTMTRTKNNDKQKQYADWW